MKIAIVGSGLAGLTAAVDLVDEGHEVEIYESRSFWGGKVGSWEDKDGNHIEMGLHVFFYNYANLFKLMSKVGALDNLLPKEHTHLFINNGGNLKSLDFRFALGAPFNGLKAFFTTEQLSLIDKFNSKKSLYDLILKEKCTSALSLFSESLFNLIELQKGEMSLIIWPTSISLPLSIKLKSSANLFVLL